MQTPALKKYPYDQWSPDARALDLVGDKWTLLIVRDLLAGPVRFVGLQRRLPGIGAEQLRTRLNRMVADGLLSRTRYREVPPRVDYELTAKGAALVPILGALARWGLAFAWDRPRDSERRDIGAVFRLAPALISLPKSVRATVLLVAGRDSYLLWIRSGTVTVTESSLDAADAASVVIAGADEDWVLALSDGVCTGLVITGDRRLAGCVLDDLTCSTRVAELGSEAA